MKLLSKKHFFSVLTVFLLCFTMTVSVPVFAAGNTASGSKNETGAETIEGAGFDTPEEAILAYAEAMKNQDMEAMVSTFAVESYVKNYDLEKQIRRMGSYNSALSSSYPPSGDDFLFSKNSAARRSEITGSINTQLLLFSAAASAAETGELSPAFKEFLSLKPHSFKNDASGVKEAEELLEALQTEPDFSSMEIGDIYYAEAVDAFYLNPKNLSNLYTQARICGADGFKSLALHVSFDGIDAFLSMDVLRYNGRWYNAKLASNISLVMGISAIYSGTIVLQPYLTKDVSPALTAENALEELGGNMKNLSDYADSLKKDWEKARKEYQENKSDASAQESLTDDFTPAEEMTFEEMASFFSMTELDASVKEQKKDAEKGSQKTAQKNDAPAAIEGKGFKTPEEAVIAYAEAMKAQDIEGMLSTFTVETYVKNYDLMTLFRSSGVAVYTMLSKAYPSMESALGQTASTEKRRASILSEINAQLLMLSAAKYAADNGELSEDFSGLLDGRVLTFEKDTDSDERIDDLITALQDYPDFSSMKIGSIYYGEVLTEDYLKTSTLNVLHRTARQAGADGIKSLGLRISFDDIDALLCMDVVRYNGRWYNLQAYGVLANLGELYPVTGGLMLTAPAMNDETASQDLDEAYKEMDAAMESVSDLAADLKKEWEAGHQEYLDSIEGMSKQEIEDAFKKAESEQLMVKQNQAFYLSYEEMLDFFSLTELK